MSRITRKYVNIYLGKLFFIWTRLQIFSFLKLMSDFTSFRRDKCGFRDSDIELVVSEILGGLLMFFKVRAY